MFIMPSFKKSLIVEQFQGNYLKLNCIHIRAKSIIRQQVWFYYGLELVSIVVEKSND